MTENAATFAFCLGGWSAWAPGLEDQDQWRQWLKCGGPVTPISAAPACEGIKPLLRRRFSLVSKIVLETVIRVCAETRIDPAGTHLIYGSANGESQTLKLLLESLSEDEPLSPTAFSNSVHHVPTGHFAMVTGHKTVSRTLSAFEDSFACAFIEAATLLAASPQKPVLLAVADEMPPQPFDRMLAVPPFPYGVALVLETPPRDWALPVLRFRPNRGTVPVTPGFHAEPVFDFLRWYLGEEPSLCLKTAFGGVVWERS